ncbi:lipopolysaccharide biosynthesis protein [Fundicoccus culcitae]|uniref:Oligosaccharide flippase family protein n=1 Tax=Fundicoccus culcitae TaxID=2969821 RepID=A0ABY5P5G3_9LACT|nr:oligosaccharide flippase family protein [Fundicoccus culcitae]UUX33850.1 oligosaccharide flippase family protein [Fundicoccus culcitae]
MKHFLKRLVGFSLGPILGAIISLIQVPILNRLLGVNEVGKAYLFQSLIVIIPTYIYFGLDQAYTREYHLYKNKRQLMQLATLIPMIAGVILFIIAIGFDQNISMWLFEDPQYYYIVWYSGVWVLATVLERFLLLTIRMEEKAIEYSMFNFLLKLGTFVVSIGLALLGWRDFKVIVYGLIFGQLFGDLILFIRYRDFLNLTDFEMDLPLLKKMLAFGIPLMIATSLSSSLTAIDNIFIKQYTTSKELGIYNSAIKIINVIGIVKTAFTSFWVPTAYRWYEERKSLKHFKFISDIVLLGLTIIFYGILIFKPVMVFLAGGEEYSDVQYIIGLLSFPHIMYTLSETTTLGIVFSRRTYLNILVSLAAFIPSILINMTLTPTLGYRGAALASFASYIMFYLARTYLSKRTGFYFGQRKQLISIALMGFVAILNAFPIEHIGWINVVFIFLTLAVQTSTIKDAISIRNNPSEWDFD